MLLSYRALSYLTLSILFYFILFFSSLHGTYKGILISNNKFAQESRSNPNLLFFFFFNSSLGGDKFDTNLNLPCGNRLFLILKNHQRGSIFHPYLDLIFFILLFLKFKLVVEQGLMIK
jgi:hypothetical protein